MFEDERHGGELDRISRAYPNARRPWIDLSTGINPWPYPDQSVSPTAIERLPTQGAYQACAEALARSVGAPIGSVVLGPGSELLIRLLPLVLLLKRVAILEPTYGDHFDVWQSAGRDVIRTDQPLDLVDEVDAIVLCNPNNPDGREFARDELLRIRSKLAARGGCLIVDEAYADLVPDLSLAGEAGSAGLIVLRSLGKFYGLAGVRLGAALAPPPIKARLSDLLGAWPVSGAALEIGQRVYSDTAWQTETRAKLTAAREALDQLLQDAGLNVLGGTDLFRFVRVPRAHKVWDRLAQHGIYVRKFAHDPEHLRIGLPKTAQETERLRAALSLSV